MKKQEDEKKIGELRTLLISYLNESGVNGRAIMTIVRKVEAVSMAGGKKLLSQNERAEYVYFLMEGEIRVVLEDYGKEKVLGHRKAITILGEIAYFNKTPATANVYVDEAMTAQLFRLRHDDFGEILGSFPDVREALARIGEMRIISQYQGFIHFRSFMELIGWRKDRFAINRAFVMDLEETITFVLLPKLSNEHKILEVGDGPGLISEMIYDHKEELLQNLYLQATHLEEAISRPLEPQPSDFSRAASLNEKFNVIIALQVFNVVPIDDLPRQFGMAHRLLEDGGLLLVVKSGLLDIRYAEGSGDSVLIFQALEELARRTWPELSHQGALVETSFSDADLEPIMEWNKDFCQMAMEGKLEIPQDAGGEETLLLKLLLSQAKLRLFSPDELHFHWLIYKAEENGFEVVKSDKRLENGFFYYIFQKK